MPPGTPVHQGHIDPLVAHLLNHQLLIEIRRMNRLLRQKTSHNTIYQANNPPTGLPLINITNILNAPQTTTSDRKSTRLNSSH